MLHLLILKGKLSYISQLYDNIRPKGFECPHYYLSATCLKKPEEYFDSDGTIISDSANERIRG